MLTLILLSVVSCSSRPETITFQNFSETVVLENISGEIYLVQGRALQVELAKRLIVKTKHLTKAQLLQIDNGISSVIAIFESETGNYFQVDLVPDQSLSEMMVRFQARSDIDLVQPDILQLSLQAEIQSNHAEITSALEQLGIPKLWKTTMGSGVKIAVIDDGFDLTHEDLQQLTTAFSYDLHRQQLNAFPAHADETHGTKIAGIVFAAHNNIGISGIAPQAELIAIRHVDTWTSKTLISFHLARLAGADIINASWNSQWLLEPVADAVTELTNHGRDGKGIAVVFAAGNDRMDIQPNSIEAALEPAIVVGALNRTGFKLHNSNFGGSVDMFVYGSQMRSTVPADTYDDFSGTSLSAAIVSGTAALLLSESPELTVAQLEEKLLHNNGILKTPKKRKQD